MAKLTTPHDFQHLENVSEQTLDKVVQMLTFAINNNDDEFIAHKSSTDHDNRYYVKDDVNGLATSIKMGLMSANDKIKMDALTLTPPLVDYTTHLGGTNPHNITPEMIGADTPADVQAKADQAEANANSYTDNLMGKVSYYQNTEPTDMTQGKIWFNPDTGQLFVANGTDYQSIPPVQVLEELVDFTESSIYISHDNTTVENGSIRLYTSFTGTTATRPVDNSTISATATRYGVRILPKKNLEGVKITISANTSAVDRVYLYQGETLLKTIETSIFLTNGSTVEIFYPLKSGVNYDILLGKSSSTYDAGYYGTPTFPYTSTDVDIVSSLVGINNPVTTSAYGILSVRASSPITSGNAIFHWQQPSSIKAWDLATYQNTLNGETITVDIVKDGTLGTTATRTNDTSTESTTAMKGLKIRPKTTLMGLSVTLSASIVNPRTLYLYDATTKVLLKSVDITGKVAGDSITVLAPLRTSKDYYVGVDSNGSSYTCGRNLTVTYPFTSTDVDIVAGASTTTGTSFTEYTGYTYNIVSVTGIGVETTFSNIPQNFDISTISPSQELWLKVNISRVSTSNIPTCDYIARRYVR